MTLNEAIKHCLEVAKENYELADKFDEWDEWEKADADNCRECAADHRQLAEWLIELKELKAADVQPVKKCKMIPQKTDCRGYTDAFLCTNCQLHIHLGFISKNYGGNFCLECGAEVEDGEQNEV